MNPNAIEEIENKLRECKDQWFSTYKNDLHLQGWIDALEFCLVNLRKDVDKHDAQR